MWFKLATANFTDKNLGKMADIAGSWGVSYSLQGNIIKNSCPTTVKMNDGKTQAEADFTATFTLGDGATLTSITATLKSSGATLVTETSNPSITIPAASITGDIVITAIASGTSSGGGSEGDDDTTDPTPDGTETNLTSQFTWTEGGVVWSSGKDRADTNWLRSNYVDIGDYTQLRFTQAQTTTVGTVLGYAFYDSSKTYISGDSNGGASSYTPIEKTIDVPSDAKYFRTMWMNTTNTNYNDSVHDISKFYCYGNL